MIIKNSVLLLKSTNANSDDKYETLLKHNNFDVKCANTLIFEFKNIDVLNEKLKRHEEFTGVVLSSPRCALALQRAADGDVLSKWKNKYNFVVGESTWKVAFEKLGLGAKGKGSGNASKLAEIILEDKELYQKPFLLPHGSLATDTLVSELRKHGVELDPVEVYNTVLNPNIEAELFDITNGFKNIPEYVVFFSPSGFNAAFPYIEKFVDDFEAIKFVTIGPTTKTALEDSNVNVYGVAKRPNPDELLNVILNKESPI